MRKILPLMLLFVIIVTSFSGNAHNSVRMSYDFLPHDVGNNGSWFLSPQVYDIVALPPDDIQKFHITVNGLWNGFFAANLTSPFAFGRYIESLFSGRNYESDEEFVNVMHDEGVLVPATILTTQGHRSFQGDKLDEWACRSIDGKLCYWDNGAKSYWMNALNDEFIDWCIQHGKKAIDAGADLIVLDEIQGSSFIPMYQWASQYIDWLDAPGFSNCTIEKFREFLAGKYSNEQLQQIFGIDNISSYDLKTRIAQTMYLTYDERVRADSLNKEYFEFLDIGNFNAKKRLIQELREYAEKNGRNIAIAANSYSIGTPRGGGYWSKGMQFADLLDFFTFENKYSALADDDLPALPRAKWLAWEKLAFASTGAPAVTLLGASEASYIASDTSHLHQNYLSILCAEAYANHGAFMSWYMKIWGNEDNWMGCADIYNFVLQHQGLYGGNINSPVAVLYLYGEGMRNKSDSYLGLAQALAESNVPYEVIFDGDGFYINDSLSVGKLAPYDIIFIPNVINITEEQKNIIFQYVEQGGNAVVFDARALGFEQDEGELHFGNGTFIFMHDVANEYFHTYDDSLRQKIGKVAGNYTSVPLHVENADRKIVAYLYYQQEKKRVVIHLVNYDHTMWNDKVSPKENVNIRIKKPDFEVGSAYLISPDFEENVTVVPSIEGDYIDITVPSLNIYDVVVISGNKGLSVKIEKPKNAFYLFDREIMPASRPVILGKITVEANASEDVIRVEFYIDGELKEVDESLPYEWLWDEFSFGRYEIKVVAYDTAGDMINDSIDVFKMM
jgi:hypothetical protein